MFDVIAVQANPADYTLSLEFENGERRVFDMKPYLDWKPFAPLKARELFEQAFIGYGTVVWPGNIDFSPVTLYDRSVPVSAPG